MCSNHIVPTIQSNDLGQCSRIGLFHVRDFCVTTTNLTPASFSELLAPVRLLIPFLAHQATAQTLRLLATHDQKALAMIAAPE
jgi:hypothetical protein